MSDNLYIAMAIFFGMYLLAAIAFYAFKLNIKLRERELELSHRVHMDQFRANLERDLIKANVEFTKDSERFEELNHLVIRGQSDISELHRARITHSAFLRAHGIEVDRLEIEPRSIFVLTPFHPDFDDFFDIVRSTGNSINYKVSRGDEKTDKSDIFPQILKGITSCRFVIANITGRNPNVFYELGIAHAIDKEVILVASGDSGIPFDLQSKRILFYDDPSELREKLALAIASLAES